MKKKTGNVLLHTYLTSLLSLVLCVVMFLGTSYAWFTSEVTNSGNEIYIGILDVELQKKVADANDPWKSLSKMEDGKNYKLYDSKDVRWEPGHTSLETIRIVDEGDLAFQYELTFTDGEMTGTTRVALKDAAKWFEVWVYDHQQDKAYVEPKSMVEIEASNSGWTRVDTLDKVLSGKEVLKGAMSQEDVTKNINTNEVVAHTYTIALHMNGETVSADQANALNALMGQKMELSVKLVATQNASEMDGLGSSSYDAMAAAVKVTADDLATTAFAEETIEQEKNAAYKLVGQFTGAYALNLPAGANIVIDGSEAEFKDGAVLKINAPGDAGSYSHVQGKARKGSYTIMNMKGHGELQVTGYNTTVRVVNNKLDSLDFQLANTKVDVVGNTIDSNSDYGIYLNAIDYDLTMTGNTVKNTNGPAMGIHGRAADTAWLGTNNKVIAKNSIECTGNTIRTSKSGAVALEIKEDTTYTSDEVNGQKVLSEDANDLILHILETKNSNTLEVPGDSKLFKIDGLQVDTAMN